MELIENINDLSENTFNMAVSDDMLTAINLGIAEGFCRNGDIEDGMALYQKIAGTGLNNIFSDEFIEKLRILANELFKNNKYTNALIQYKRLLKLTGLNAQEYLNIANCLIELGQKEASLNFLKKYEENEPNKEEAYGNICEIFGFKLKMYPEAILYLEKYIELNQKNALAYNTLGHFYSTYYNDKHLDKQLACFLAANKLHPNNKMYINNVIYAYEKLGDVQNTQKFYEKLLKLNPTDLDYYEYACFLIKQGNFKDGYKYFEHRFFAPEVTHEYPKWLDYNKRLKTYDGLSDKTVLLFHEAGYGDSIMYVRFVKQLQKHVKKIILFIPEKMISLFNHLGLDVEIHPMTDDLTELEYDYNASLVDLANVMSVTPDSIPNTDGYINIPQEKIIDYKNKYLKDTKKLKIGISYCANPRYNNITKRDIPLETFYPLTKLENVEVYSLQVADSQEQIKHLPPDIKIINLAETFKNFEDAACAIKNLDLIITTDNVILNLAGALGAKTFALFNRFPEYRWFNLDGDVGWYKSVKPFCAKTIDDWDELMDRVIETLSKKEL